MRPPSEYREHTMKIVADLDLCQGHAVCATEAPTVFSVPKRGRVHILRPNPGADVKAEVDNAIRYCPTRALLLVADDSIG
nr:ferredoxin [Nocardia paucivorans]